MEKKNSISELLQESMEKVREMADTNTIVGQPIQTPDGVTLIPISRISMGMGGGGMAFGNKKKEADAGASDLGAGVGVGVKIDPVAFLVVKDGFTRIMPVAMPPMSTVDRVIEMVPNIVDQVNGIVQSYRQKKEDPAEDGLC